MVTIRLSRGGAKKRPFYHIVVTDSRKRLGSGYIERLGFYNPMAKGQEERLRLDIGRVKHWQSHGAGVSERISSLMKGYKETVAAVAEAPKQSSIEA